MRYTELTETTRNLGGFNVKVIASVPSGAEQEVDEASGPVTHRIGLTVTDPNHPMVSKRKETYQKSVRVTADDKEKAINSAIAHARRKGYKVHDHHYIGTVDEAQLDELSPKTLGSYAKKAAVDAKFKGHIAGSQQGDAMAHAKRPGDGADAGADIDDQAHKRLRGVARAVDKLTGQGVAEGEQLDELSPGVVNRTVNARKAQMFAAGDKAVAASDAAGGNNYNRQTRQAYEKWKTENPNADYNAQKAAWAEIQKQFQHLVNKDQVPAAQQATQAFSQAQDRYSKTKNLAAQTTPGSSAGIDQRSYYESVEKNADLARMLKHAGVPVSEGVAEGSELKQAKRKYNQAAKDANADQVGAGRKIDTMKKSLRQKDVDNKKEIDEAIKLDAPQKSWSRDDMQDYLTRIKTGTKTKQDRFKPIIHGSNVKAITKDDGNQEWDLDDLARQITTRPRAILGTNAKMAKSKVEGSITYDLTLPALSGIVVDEETGEFVEITTCPGAGECQLYCYARKGGYVMFPASSMSAAQALNFLVNHPSEYMQMFDQEVKKAKALATKNGIKLLVRVHDAGDFFSKEYYDLVMGVKEQNPDCKFYFYTKMGAIASADQPDDVIGQFSPGAKSREVKTVQVTRDAGKHVKDAETLPKEMFRNLFVTDAKGKYIKDEKGRTQVKSPEVWAEFKQKLADIYRLDVDTIVTYDEMNRIPEGPKPKWNVVVFPAGHGDLGASRLDVSKQFLMFH